MTNSMRRHNRPRPTSAKEVLQTPVANTKKLTILVDADLHRKFQLATIAKGRTMTEVINEFIEDYTTKRP
ncbi:MULTISPECIES: hypothetical protein [Corynebacterium]|uniref:ParG n=1 Tax=Corynebacterium belfantii TaxID=2014537 RepID=A0ABS0LC26_9CORY|nr:MULTISPECIES: hypothetical protein [Corynebacterium]OWM36832.1 hypothetical protein AZF07_08670 [Corynebacterium diphtheriae subsp. lausannense]QVI97720.1 hypothetical protein KFR76_08925 [Corynebacterium diphtheriae]MBG9243806.1 hypothetical protein [Corynebacterium belfantii]MBG9258962.1 hypothetical protein [Corynebacterium belfantii]MBG9265722.1 hypothetical protein [Corynebacterium belfantii]